MAVPQPGPSNEKKETLVFDFRAAALLTAIPAFSEGQRTKERKRRRRR